MQQLKPCARCGDKPGKYPIIIPTPAAPLMKLVCSDCHREYMRYLEEFFADAARRERVQRAEADRQAALEAQRRAPADDGYYTKEQAAQMRADALWTAETLARFTGKPLEVPWTPLTRAEIRAEMEYVREMAAQLPDDDEGDGE